MGAPVVPAFEQKPRAQTILFDDLDEAELRELLGLKRMAREDQGLAGVEKPQRSRWENKKAGAGQQNKAGVLKGNGWGNKKAEARQQSEVAVFQGGNREPLPGLPNHKRHSSPADG